MNIEDQETLWDYFDPKPKTLYSIELESEDIAFTYFCFLYYLEEENIVILIHPVAEYGENLKYVVAQYDPEDPTLVPIIGFGIDMVAVQIREIPLEKWLTHKDSILREFAKKFTNET